jgi:cytoskeletal protein RodZ
MSVQEDFHSRNQKKVLFAIVGVLMFLLLLWSIFIYRQLNNNQTEPNNPNNIEQEKASAEESNLEYQPPTNDTPPSSSPGEIEDNSITTKPLVTQDKISEQTNQNDNVAEENLVDIKESTDTNQKIIEELQLSLDSKWSVQIEESNETNIKNFVLSSQDQEIHFHLQKQDETPCEQLNTTQEGWSKTVTLPNNLIEYQNTISGIELLYTKSTCDTITLQSQLYEVIIDARVQNTDSIESVRSVIGKIKL